jgi:predicted ABC-type ATPase
VPVLTVFAGPNGSGKSSITRGNQFEGKERLLDPDAIALRIAPGDSRQGGIEAGREVLIKARDYIRDGHSFAVETTLSGSWILGLVETALADRFYVHLVYVCVDNPEISIQRVRERAARGGHSVPDADIRRRFGRSLLNLRRLLPLVSRALMYDNSEDQPRFVMEIRDGVILQDSTEDAPWARSLVEYLNLPVRKAQVRG